MRFFGSRVFRICSSRDLDIFEFEIMAVAIDLDGAERNDVATSMVKKWAKELVSLQTKGTGVKNQHIFFIYFNFLNEPNASCVVLPS